VPQLVSLRGQHHEEEVFLDGVRGIHQGVSANIYHECPKEAHNILSNGNRNGLGFCIVSVEVEASEYFEEECFEEVLVEDAQLLEHSSANGEGDVLHADVRLHQLADDVLDVVGVLLHETGVLEDHGD
jgi:hypothetical protein